MVRKRTNVRQAPHIWMRSLRIHPKGETDQVGTPCNEVRISWLWNRQPDGEFKLHAMGWREPEINPEQ